MMRAVITVLRQLNVGLSAAAEVVNSFVLPISASASILS